MSNEKDRDEEIQKLPRTQNPQSVDPLLVKVASHTTESGIEVKDEVPHTDLADIRADDPPSVAQEKIDRAHEQIRDLQADSGVKTSKESSKTGRSDDDKKSSDGSKNPFASAGTNKEAEGKTTPSSPADKK